MRRMPRALPFTVWLLALAGPAAATTIGAILDAPASFDGQQVTITGTVVAPVAGLRGESTFNLQDGNRRMSVFSATTPPHLGDRLQVSGKIGYRTPDEEFTFPPVLVESAREPAP